MKGFASFLISFAYTLFSLYFGIHYMTVGIENQITLVNGLILWNWGLFYFSGIIEIVGVFFIVISYFMIKPYLVSNGQSD